MVTICLYKPLLNPGSDTIAFIEPPFLRCYNENQKVHVAV